MENRFRLIVAGVARGHQPSSDLLGCLAKEFVSCLAGGGLDSVGGLLIEWLLRLACMEWQTELLAKRSDHCLVTVGSFSAESVIEMGDKNPPITA
jgi:hypothetical protein